MVAAFLMATPAIDSTAVRFSRRLAGITLGATLAIAIIGLFLPELSRIQQLELFIFAVFWVCSFVNYRSEKSAIAGLQANITFAVVFLRDPHQSADLLAIWQRVQSPCSRSCDYIPRH
jgi:uncharacterized membrane protein YccC